MVSALGTKLCFYSLNATDGGAEIEPEEIPRHSTRLNDTAPADCWDCDLLDPAGEKPLREVVHKVKDRYQNLNSLMTSITTAPSWASYALRCSTSTAHRRYMP